MDDIATPQPSHEPLPVNIGLSEQHRKQLAEGLQGVLADSYTLLGKTHGFHWNVVGPQFHSLHEMFEEQYQDLQDAVDDIAERIRALGFLAPGSLSQFLRLTTIVVRICHDADDTVTEDLMNQRLRAHEKAAWMLRASLQQ
jgi:starvation-inducible DNA-binding protein